MIEQLKMRATEIYVKAIRDNLLQYVVCHQVRDGERHQGKVGIQFFGGR